MDDCDADADAPIWTTLWWLLLYILSSQCTQRKHFVKWIIERNAMPSTWLRITATPLYLSLSLSIFVFISFRFVLFNLNHAKQTLENMTQLIQWKYGIWIPFVSFIGFIILCQGRVWYAKKKHTPNMFLYQILRVRLMIFCFFFSFQKPIVSLLLTDRILVL